MITISLWQPWAVAMFVPREDDSSRRMLKEFETRGWAPSPKLLRPGDRLAIQASKTQRNPKTRERLYDVWMKQVKRTRYGEAFAAAGFADWSDLPFGAIIGYGTFVEAIRTEAILTSGVADQTEQDWGDYSPGRFAWRMRDMVRLPNPIPCQGKQSLFASEVPSLSVAV